MAVKGRGKMKVGEKIKKRRKDLGISAERLAAQIGVSPGTVYRYENSDIENMGANRLKPIAEALQTTPDYLLGWTDDPAISGANGSGNGTGLETWNAGSGAMRLAEQKPAVETDGGLAEKQQYLIDKIKASNLSDVSKICQIVTLVLGEDK